MRSKCEESQSQDAATHQLQQLSQIILTERTNVSQCDYVCVCVCVCVREMSVCEREDGVISFNIFSPLDHFKQVI
jgi:hypothetical protein